MKEVKADNKIHRSWNEVIMSHDRQVASTKPSDWT
jgi:hypothetical protein